MKWKIVGSFVMDHGSKLVGLCIIIIMSHFSEPTYYYYYYYVIAPVYNLIVYILEAMSWSYGIFHHVKSRSVYYH